MNPSNHVQNTLTDVADYGTAVWANKGTFAGYVSLATYAGACVAESIAPSTGGKIMLLSSLISTQVAMALTAVGLPTLDAYQKTRASIREQGTLTDAIKTRFDRNYNDRTGMLLAVKEADLGHLL